MKNFLLPQRRHVASTIILMVTVVSIYTFAAGANIADSSTSLAEWQQQFPEASPQARDLGALTYDSKRGVTVLFGGRLYQASRFLDDTCRDPLHSPTARASQAAAFDSNRNRLVLFGGFDGGWPNTTWEWDGNDWEEITKAISPSGRTSTAVAYDSKRGVVVLFGGFGAHPMIDTWEWDGINWVEKFPLISPPARHRHKIVYDSQRERVILFGGSSATQQLNDTWEWDGSNWVKLSPPQSPAPRADFGMAYDEDRAKVIVFGGRLSKDNNLNDTWEWDGSNWIETSPSISPSARIYPTMAYDSKNKVTVLFAGSDESGEFNDTWVYKELSVEVDIDIKPGDSTNCINNNGHGVISVAILGSDTFDVESVDVLSLDFSGMGVRIKGNGSQQCSFQEINHDAHLDLVCQFQDVDSVWDIGETVATVTGMTFEGLKLIGSDELCIVP